MPFDRACLIGCGVMTGVGAALNIAQIGHGDTVMVIGCGAVGLSAVQGARLAGAGAIIAVDLDDAKLALAGKLGATHTRQRRSEDAGGSRASRRPAGRGADVVLEAAGSPRRFAQPPRRCGRAAQVIWLGKIDVDKRRRLPLGLADGREAHPPVELWRRAAARATFRCWRGPISTAASSSTS